jgi:hypothetical protein
MIYLFLLPALAAAQTGDSSHSRHAAKPLHPLTAIEPGCWAALGENSLYDVRFVPEPAGKYIKTVMTAWSGAAYNTDDDQLWVHGGGHGDGADNAVYAFDVETLTWSRLFDPSQFVYGHTGRYYTDGKPAAVHSYDYLEYVPALKRMVVAGACGPFPGSTLHTTVDAVDAAGQWRHLADLPYSYHPMAAVHPETGVLWHHGGETSGHLNAYDPGADAWLPFGDSLTDHLPGCYRTAAIDPKNREFVIIQAGSYSDNSVWVWDIAFAQPGMEIKGKKLNMTGDTDILFVSGPPGLDWHGGKEKLYAWFGGVDVYEIDTQASRITRVPVSPRNKVIPTPGTDHGVFGRWRYVEKYNVFLGVNQVEEPVFFFKLP